MVAWRVILTDSESLSGVGPVCEKCQNTPWVKDCCPHPHIETYSEHGAAELATLLSDLDAGPCL